MKTPQQIRNEVEKGCGKYIGTWKTSQKIICGCYTNMLELCPKCQAKLSILTEYDKSIKEMIEEMLFHKFCSVCGLNICNCGERKWVVDVNVINECFEDLSKIGDVQQSKEKRNEK